jgi:hypothetical protein
MRINRREQFSFGLPAGSLAAVQAVVAGEPPPAGDVIQVTAVANGYPAGIQTQPHFPCNRRAASFDILRRDALRAGGRENPPGYRVRPASHMAATGAGRRKGTVWP